MQLRLKHRTHRSLINRSLIIKIVLFAAIFILAIFLLDKLDMPAPSKLIKQEISNEKLIKIK